MKLKIKRLPADHLTPGGLFLATEDGEVLPDQGKVEIITTAGEFPRLVVTFAIIPGGDVDFEGI